MFHIIFPGHKLSSSLFAFKICLCHPSVTLFVNDVAPSKDPPLNYEDSLHLKIIWFYPLS